MSLKDRINFIISTLCSIDKELGVERKPNVDKEILRKHLECDLDHIQEMRLKEKINEKKKIESAENTYEKQVHDDITKMYTDAFLSRWVDHDLKELENQINDKTNADKNKQWAAKQPHPVIYLSDYVTTFGRKANPTDEYAMKAIEKQINDAKITIEKQMEVIPNAHTWSLKSLYDPKNWNEHNFTSFKRCKSVVKILNSNIENNNYSFECEPHLLTRFEKDYNFDGTTSMYLSRRIDSSKLSGSMK